MKACILLQTRPGDAGTVASNARDEPEVEEAAEVFGVPDVVVRAEVDDHEALGDLVARLEGKQGFRSSETLPELEVA